MNILAGYQDRPKKPSETLKPALFDRAYHLSDLPSRIKYSNHADRLGRECLEEAAGKGVLG